VEPINKDIPGDVTARTWRNPRGTTVTGGRITVVENGKEKRSWKVNNRGLYP
jgi:hypothetical protein